MPHQQTVKNHRLIEWVLGQMKTQKWGLGEVVSRMGLYNSVLYLGSWRNAFGGQGTGRDMIEWRCEKIQRGVCSYDLTEAHLCCLQ
jgi:hypothetical protein